MIRGRHESMLIISHQERIMELADEIMVVAGGKITQDVYKRQIDGSGSNRWMFS